MNRVIKIAIFLGTALALGFLLGSYGTISADILEGLPWYLSRSSAIAAYLVLFCLVTWGMGMAVGLTYKISKPARAWRIHQEMGIVFGLLVVFHAFGLLFDNFIGFGALDILVPFYASFSPVFLSLGIISFYFLSAIIITSMFMRLSRPRLWRVIHYLAYPLFVMATVHGFFLGTDSKTLAMQGVYIAASFIFTGLAVYRFLVYPRKFKRKH